MKTWWCVLAIFCACAHEPVAGSASAGPEVHETAAAFWHSQIRPHVPFFSRSGSLQREALPPRSPNAHPALDGTWEQVLALAVGNFNALDDQIFAEENIPRFDADALDRKAFVGSAFLPYVGEQTNEMRVATLQAFSRILQDEQALLDLVDWALPLLPKLIEDEERALRWIEALYRGNTNLLVRFHLVRLALAFDHKDAETWAEQTRSDLRTYGAQYALTDAYLQILDMSTFASLPRS